MTDPATELEPEWEDCPRQTFLVIRLGEELFATEIASVQEVLRTGRIFPVPEASRPVLGVLNLRGQVVTVLSGHRLLGGEEPPEAPAARMLVLERGDDLLAVRVDRVAGVVHVAEEDIRPPIEAVRPGGAILGGNFHMRGNVVNLLNLRETLERRLAEELVAAPPAFGRV